MFHVRKLTQKTFDDDAVIAHLNSVVESNSYTLPCKLDSWHGFESLSISKLDKLGSYLERKLGWRYVGAWEIDSEDGRFHARVAKFGIYDQQMILTEVPKMLKLANKFQIEWYVDCAPQPEI